MRDWRRDALLTAPWVSAQLAHHIRRLPNDHWPAAEQLNTLLPERARTATGQPIRFACQTRRLSALDYERAIYWTGEVPTRLANWHDLLNALMWVSWPRAKAALNAAHVTDANLNARTGRSRRRDTLTLLDECGVVVATVEADVAARNRAHDWQDLFQTRRDQWQRTIWPILLGHGLAEQLMHPYPGLTGKAFYITVDNDYADLESQEQQQRLDGYVAQHIAQNPNLTTPRGLMPLPVLGIPGWHAANSDPRYYRNSSYFKSQPGRSVAGVWQSRQVLAKIDKLQNACANKP